MGPVTPRIEIGIDSTSPESLAPFWAVALGYEVGDLDVNGVYLDLIPPLASDATASRAAQRPAVYLQRVSEPKTTKNRLHLDLMVEDPETVIASLVALGAHTLGEPRSGSEGGWWQVMLDPEGNEFCVCQEYDGEPLI